MNQRLRNLLLAITGVTITAIPVFVLRPGVTRADLVDAGAGEECSKVLIRAEAYVDGDYRTFRTRALLCGDAGIILPKMPPRAILFREDLVELVDRNGCTVASACDDDQDGEAKFDPEPGRCACRSTVGGAGLCRWRDPFDGGAVPAPFNTTLQPGNFQGAGCVPKACAEIAGFSSMPSECL